jgi:hypothetical protein
MWKTNKWVPEWVIRHAIAHLHGLSILAGACMLYRSRVSKLRTTGWTETTTFSHLACSELPRARVPAHDPPPLYLKAEK